jgi:hypothetical protein
MTMGFLLAPSANELYCGKRPDRCFSVADACGSGGGHGGRGGGRVDGSLADPQPTLKECVPIRKSGSRSSAVAVLTSPWGAEPKQWCAVPHRDATERRAASQGSAGLIFALSRHAHWTRASQATNWPVIKITDGSDRYHSAHCPAGHGQNALTLISALVLSRRSPWPPLLQPQPTMFFSEHWLI